MVSFMNYIKEINKRFNILDLFFCSIFIVCGLYLLDYFDIPSYIYIEYNVILVLVVIILFCFIFKEIINKKLWKIISNETINFFDEYLLVGLSSEILMTINFFFMSKDYKFILYIFLLVNLIIILCRIVKFEMLYRKKRDKKINSYNILELYNNEIVDEKYVLLEEKAIVNSKNDLLNIDLFVDNFEQYLLNCLPKENFIVSLIGKWGTGKTSVINLLKEKINSGDEAVIEVFEPWKYDNKLSLFKGFNNYIFRCFGRNYGYFSRSEVLKKYEKLVFNFNRNDFGISIDNLFKLDDEKEVEEVKASINDCIMFSSKKLFVVIDDIDRLDKDQILLIFKVIKTIFDFNNIVYILCYDEERIKKIFEKELNIDSNYLDKIVQNKISIPNIEKGRITEIGSKCIVNLLEIYDIDILDCDRLKDILDIIFAECNDLREIIRFINSISFSIKCCQILQLDICDYIALEYIKFKNFNLYNIIYSNEEMFISEDREYNYMDSTTFNVKAKSFFDNLFENNPSFLGLLSKVFPYVENYKQNPANIRPEVFFKNDSREKSILLKRCCNRKYFKCYFSVKRNFFTELSSKVDSFIKIINSDNCFFDDLDCVIKEINSNNYDVLFELMEIRINEVLNKDKLFYYILKNITSYENNSRFLALNSHERAKILLASIIRAEDNLENKKKYLLDISENSLLLLDSIFYWLNDDKYGIRGVDSSYNYGKEILCNKLDKIISSNIDIFSNENYERHFCYLFNKYLENNRRSKRYLNGLVNKDNIFRVISEGVSIWNGTKGISYEYNEHNIENLFTISKLNKILKSVDYDLNIDQIKIKDLFINRSEKHYLDEINFDNL